MGHWFFPELFTQTSSTLAQSPSSVAGCLQSLHQVLPPKYQRGPCAIWVTVPQRTCPPSPTCHLKTVATVTGPQGHIISVRKYFFQLLPIGIFFSKCPDTSPEACMEERHQAVLSISHLLHWASAHKISTSPSTTANALMQINSPKSCTPTFQKGLHLFAVKFRNRVRHPQNDFDIGFKALYLNSILLF